MSSSSDDDDDVSESDSDESVRVCECSRCYEGSIETCRECGCSGCETDTTCLYPDSDEENYVTHDAQYWELKANANQDTANYLTVDLRKLEKKVAKIQTLCDRRVQFARNEEIRMKASTEEKIMLIEADCGHRVELAIESEKHMLDVVKSRAKEISKLEYERDDQLEEIERLRTELSEAISQKKSQPDVKKAPVHVKNPPSSVRRSTRKRTRA
jgi:hypothetical protein